MASKKKLAPTFSENIREKVAQYMMTAFGLVAGLAWNDAITSLIQTFFPIGKGTMVAKFVYAFVITAVVVIVGVYLIRPLEEKS